MIDALLAWIDWFLSGGYVLAAQRAAYWLPMAAGIMLLGILGWMLVCLVMDAVGRACFGDLNDNADKETHPKE